MSKTTGLTLAEAYQALMEGKMVKHDEIEAVLNEFGQMAWKDGPLIVINEYTLSGWSIIEEEKAKPKLETEEWEQCECGGHISYLSTSEVVEYAYNIKAHPRWLRFGGKIEVNGKIRDWPALADFVVFFNDDEDWECAGDEEYHIRKYAPIAIMEKE